jgi:hypothetical protein
MLKTDMKPDNNARYRKNLPLDDLNNLFLYFSERNAARNVTIE